MAAPEGPPRFKCPPDFSACRLGPGGPFSQETLQEPSKELWLIRAPANFSPESFDGHFVPLLGFQTLKASQADGTEKIFHIQSALEHLAGAHLLLPAGHGDHLTCSPQFSGSLSICERYGGDHSNDQPLFPVVARPAPQIPEGLKQRFLPFGNHPERPPLPGAAEEPPRKKRKKKKKHRLGEEDSEDQLPLLGTALGEAAGAGEAEPGRWHQVDGAALLAAGSQANSTATAPNGVLFGEAEAPATFSKKKKKKKRKEDGEPKEAVRGEAEAGPQHENGAALWAADSQLSSATNAQDGLSGEAEELDPRSKKKRRRKDREVKEEVGDEAEAPQQHKEDGAASWAVGSLPEAPPDSATFAHNSLLSGEVEAPGPRRKKKKRKEDGEPKEAARGEAEAGPQHENGAALWAVDSQPSSAANAQDGLLSGEAEEPDPSSKKKKKRRRKDDGEVKEEVGDEAEAPRQHKEDGAALWAVNSPPEALPDSAAFAHNALLSGEVEAPGPRSKKKKKKRKEDRELKEETRREAEAASPQQADGTMLWAIGCQPHSAAVAQDSLLFGKAEDPAPVSKKKKKKRKEGELKEETKGEAEAAHLHKEDGAALWEIGSQPNSQPVAPDGLLPGEAENPAPISKKKKKKRKEGQEAKEEAGVEAEVLLDMSSRLGGGSEPHTGEGSLPGMAELIHGAHTGGKKEKAVLPEPLSGQEDSAGSLWDFSGPGPTPEDRLDLAEEEPGGGSSSRKAKKKKRKKEKEEPEEGAQELEGWPAPQGVESWAVVGTPPAGGGGQEAEPSMEELSQKRKKKQKQKEHHRRQAAEEGLAWLEEEVGNL